MKKILLYLSELKGQNKNLDEKQTSDEKQTPPKYRCPDNIEVFGTQSNEAPVKFLLERYNDVSEIICIVTKEARQTAKEAEMPAWDFFNKEIKKKAPQIPIIAIDYDYDQENGSESIEKLVEQVLSYFKEDDEILLETTGGPRDAIIYFLLISRILSHAEIPVEAAVYSNFNKKKVGYLSDTIQLFDLVEGMQELTSFGSVEKIRDYYNHSSKKDEKIDHMLKAAEDLTETISLCRTTKLDEKMENFNAALVEAQKSDDILFRHMLAAFTEKFVKEKWDVLSVLNWCVESGMVQQALTVYTERIPAYIFATKLIEADETVKKPEAKEYEDKYAVLFTKGFLAIGEKFKSDNTVDQFKKFLEENRSAICMAAKNSSFSVNKFCPNPEYRSGVNRIFKILRYFYSTDKRDVNEEKIKRFQKENVEFASENFEKFMCMAPKTKETLYDQVCRNSNSILELLLGKEEKEKKEKAIVTLEHLEEVLPGSGFQVHCSCEEIRKVAEDYRYAKYLRNMVNHANADGATENKQFLEYLYQRKYKNIEEMSLQEIKDFIIAGVKRIEELEGNLVKEKD